MAKIMVEALELYGLKDNIGATYYIYKNKSFTPYGTVVEYADYYEYAGWSAYFRIMKKTMEVFSNVKNSSKFEKDDRFRKPKIVLVESIWKELE